MSSKFLAALLLSACTSLPAQQAPPTPTREVSIDSLLGMMPKQPISKWVAAEGRAPVSLQMPDGIVLRGFHYASPDAGAPEILFFNGAGMTVAPSDRLYRLLVAQGAAVTVYDYRGWGFSDGAKADPMQSQSDAAFAYDSTSLASIPRRVIVYGMSLGTAYAAYVAGTRNIDAVVLGMPIASAREEFPVFATVLGLPPDRIATIAPDANAVALFDETGLMARSSAPLLVIAGAADHVVPLAQNREVFRAAASTGKRMVEVPGADHYDVPQSAAALAALKQFLQNFRRDAISSEPFATGPRLRPSWASSGPAVAR